MAVRTMSKFKIGDEVICFRRAKVIEYTNMKGVIVGKELLRDLWEVQLTMCPIYKKENIVWVFDDKEMRHLTKLDRELE